MKVTCRLIFLILCVLLLAGGAQAATLYVNVFEKTTNVTAIPSASVFVNGALAGKTGNDGIFAFTHPGNSPITVKVMKPGYESWEDDVGMAESSILVQLRKKELVLNIGIFDADSAIPVANSQVRVMGPNVTESLKMTDMNGSVTFPAQAASIYNIQITATNYQNRNEIVEMGMEGKNIQYLLIRGDRFSILAKSAGDQSPVANAEVFIDGVSKGKTDGKGILSLEIPRNKVYNIKIAKPGFTDYYEKKLISDSEAVVTASMAIAPYQASIFVFDETKAPVQGASIIIDGKALGNTSQYGKYTFHDLPSGQYVLEVKHPGFSSLRREIGEDDLGKDITVELPFQQADLSIFVEDEGYHVIPGVSISLNGRNTGVTDDNGALKTKVKVSTEYNITATMKGYKPVTTTTGIDPGNTSSTITLSMEKDLNLGIFLTAGLIVAVIIIIILVILLVVRRKPKTRSSHSNSKVHGSGGGGKKGEI
jgi:hypothetical protein